MPADDSPTARALRTLEALQDRPGVTAGELAGLLGVSERAARRYVAILRESGFTVDSVRGPYGGYRLGRGTRLPPVTFTQSEALGLVMAVLDGRPSAADATADDPVGTALGKVLRALPGEVGRQAAAFRQQAAATPDRWPAPVDPGVTGQLAAAAAEGWRVSLTYCPDSGAEWEGQMEPWAVVVRHGRWYLLGHSLRAAAPRAYRIDRVRRVTVLPDRFDPPAGLDPVVALEEHLASGWEYATRVRFAASLDAVCPWVRGTMGRLEPAADGGCLLVGSTSNPRMYAAEWLAALPFPFEIEGGPELRAAMEHLVDRLRHSVGDPAGG